jgi:hypothetical protein
MSAKHSKALVTLAVGRKFEDQVRRICQPTWSQYAERWGYDVICLNQALDASPRAAARSPAWQKCLVLSQPFAREYERIVWLDSDIVINPHTAPDIADGIPIDKVGAVELYSAPTPDLYADLLRRMYEYWDTLYGPVAIKNYTPRDYYLRWGLPYGFDSAANTGVMVLSPRHHREILEHVYHAYEEKAEGGRGVWHMEQRPLSWELMKADAFAWLNPRFNVNWWELKFAYYPFLVQIPSRVFSSRVRRRLYRLVGYSPARPLTVACVNAAFWSSYFLHFTGGQDEIADAQLIDYEAASWRACCGR